MELTLIGCVTFTKMAILARTKKSLNENAEITAVLKIVKVNIWDLLN